MRIDAIADSRPCEDLTAARHHFTLTANELMQLGLFRVGYVTEAMVAGRGVEIVVHGANGMAIATANSIEHAVDIADHLGLVLIPVH